MINRRKDKTLLIVLAVVVTIISVCKFKPFISKLLDTVFIFLIGKSFTQRGHFVQWVVLSVFALLIFLAIYGWLHLLKQQQNKTIKTLEILTPFAVCFVLLMIICLHQTIRRDDYWEITDAKNLGVFGYVSYNFRMFNGRYFSLFLRSLYSVFPPCQYINWMLILNIFLLFVAMTILSDFLLKKCCEQVPENKIKWLGLSMGVSGTLAILFMSPNIWEVWFWGSGTFVYGVGITQTLLSCGLILKCSFTFDQSVHPLWYIAAFAAITFSCGCSELTVVSMIIFALAIPLIAHFLDANRSWNRTAIILGIWCWICGAVSLFSPGNYGNSQAFIGLSSPNALQLITYILSMLWNSLGVVSHNIIWYTYSRLEFLLIFSVLAFIFGTQVRIKTGIKVSLFISSAVFLVTAWVSLLINALVGYMPARVLSIPLSWIFLSIGLLCFWAGSVFISKERDITFFPSLGICSLSCLLLMSWFFVENIQLILDIEEGWEYRHQILTSQTWDDWTVMTCSIPVLGSNSMDLSQDQYYEFNLVTAKYYGFPEIAADSYCPPFR